MSAPAGRALVIGGSLAGLFAGLLLRRQFAVDIYERADAELAGRGAGIVTHELLGEALDAAGIAWRAGLGIEVQTRRFFDRDGQLKLEYPYRQTLTAWDRLYDMLRRAFPAAHYHGGKELVAVEERSGGVAARFIIARARELGACLQSHHATAAERANAARFRTPQATLQETATLEFLAQ